LAGWSMRPRDEARALVAVAIGAVAPLWGSLLASRTVQICRKRAFGEDDRAGREGPHPDDEGVTHAPPYARGPGSSAMRTCSASGITSNEFPEKRRNGRAA